jgi:hypothetical protein
MNRLWLLVIVSFSLHGCAKPKFEFRGYSDLSSCTEIIDAELAAGASFQGGYPSEDIENPGYITELSGSIFAERVQIEILCGPAGFVESIHYISQTTEPAETGAIWARFSSELEALFGPPTEIFSENGRTRRYLCHRPAPVFVDEWRLDLEEGEEEEDEKHEIYLAVQPRAVECLDEGGG